MTTCTFRQHGFGLSGCHRPGRARVRQGPRGGCWEPERVSQRNAAPDSPSIGQCRGVRCCPSSSLRRKERKKTEETYLYETVAKRPGRSPQHGCHHWLKMRPGPPGQCPGALQGNACHLAAGSLLSIVRYKWPTQTPSSPSFRPRTHGYLFEKQSRLICDSSLATVFSEKLSHPSLSWLPVTVIVTAAGVSSRAPWRSCDGILLCGAATSGVQASDASWAGRLCPLGSGTPRIQPVQPGPHCGSSGPRCLAAGVII